MPLKRRCAHRTAHSTAEISASSLLTRKPKNSKMQKIVLCTLAVIAVALAAPQQPQPHEHNPVQILKQDSDVNPEGYNFDFETSDGTARQEKGTLKEFEHGHKAIEVNGSYKYVGTDGLEYTVNFVANEHGFQPQEHVSQPGQH